jgi:hypothetical protein
MHIPFIVHTSIYVDLICEEIFDETRHPDTVLCIYGFLQQ